MLIQNLELNEQFWFRGIENFVLEVKKYIFVYLWVYKCDMCQNDKIFWLVFGKGVDCDLEIVIECWVLGVMLLSLFFFDGGVRLGFFIFVWCDEEVLVIEVR